MSDENKTIISILDPTPEAKAYETERFQFRGNGVEYFKIWIVNTLLTVVTLGIFSAWAKVRARRYLYGNTFLKDSNFDYHADPVKILIGRTILAIPALLFFFGGYISVYTPLIAFGVLLLVFPWIIVRGMIFNLRNTSFRNVRFDFNKNYKESYKTYVLGTLVTIFTLGLGTPFAFYLIHKFLVNNTKYGDTKFEFKGGSDGFYRIYLPAAGVYIGAIILMIVLFAIFGRAGILISILSPIISYGALLISFSIIKAGTFNYIASKTNLGSVRFKSHVKATDIFELYLTNVFIIGFTLGLGTPWALIRLYKYRLENLDAEVMAGTFDEFVGSFAPAEGALADAAADIWDVDLGI